MHIRTYGDHPLVEAMYFTLTHRIAPRVKKEPDGPYPAPIREHWYWHANDFPVYQCRPDGYAGTFFWLLPYDGTTWLVGMPTNINGPIKIECSSADGSDASSARSPYYADLIDAWFALGRAITQLEPWQRFWLMSGVNHAIQEDREVPTA